MYKKQNRDKQKDIRVVSLEDLVPRDHLLRKIDRAINFDFIYEEVKDLYSATEWGKPGIDPVSLFKIVLIQHLYGIRSMRQTLKEIEVNYVANTACDRHNFVLGFVLGAGFMIATCADPMFRRRRRCFCAPWPDTSVYPRAGRRLPAVPGHPARRRRCSWTDADAGSPE